ncbi:MAG: alpha amylase N-terminal ig-like domain-containing protein [Bacilli bacterium]
MELSSIYHVMDETFAYKVDEHKYVIRLITKKNDVERVQIAYLEKYFREKNLIGVPSTTFYLDMKKVASTKENDYFEAIVSDQIIIRGVEEKINEFLNNNKDKNIPPFAYKIIEDVKTMEGKLLTMLSLSYYFVLSSKNETRYYGNYKFLDNEPKEVLDMFNLVIYQADSSYFKTPSWSKGAVIYQIFPERFAPTDDNYSSSWFDVPMDFRTRTNGTIKGIKQKIPYLKELGIDAIYLTPIFLANSSHRYDTIDYKVIDPLLGSEEEFKELIDELHKNDIKIILDLVFNHSSTSFFAFQDLLKNQENSIYKDWYFIEEFPFQMRMPSSYMGFSFSPWMPKLNTSNKECRKYLFDVSAYYLEKFNIDGYRLDVANEVTHDFWKEFRKLCKGINPDCLIMGEIWFDSRTYLRGDEFDSVMNYTYYDAIRGLLNKRFSLDEFISIIERERGEESLTYYHNSNLLVGSHDTDRIFYALGKNENKYLQAMTLLFTLPGSPLLYYGDEKMMDGGNDPDCRRGMIFDKEFNKEQFNLIKKLIAIKHMKEFRYGDIAFVETNKYLSYLRIYEEKETLVILNLEDEDLSLNQYKGYINLLTDTIFEGELKGLGVAILKK